MKRQISKRDTIQGLLLLVVFAALLSFAGTSDLENQQAITKDIALFRVER